MKKHLLTGLVILLPIALTLMIIIFLFDFFTEPFVTVVGPLVELIQQKINIDLPHGITLFISRIFSLILLCAFIFLLGLVTQLFLIRTLIHWGNLVLYRIPLIRTVYKVSKDIFGALFSTEGEKAFKRPVMIPFPAKPNHCLGFEAGSVASECREKAGIPLVSVFVPTAPHPISGFLFLIPESDVHGVDMNNEEAVKFLVSCGMIAPGHEMEGGDEHPF